MFRAIRAFVLRMISEDVKYWSDLALDRGGEDLVTRQDY